MKKGIHPDNYRPVVFKDMSNGDMFLSRSTAKNSKAKLTQWLKSKSRAPLTRSIPVRASLWILQVA